MSLLQRIAISGRDTLRHNRPLRQLVARTQFARIGSMPDSPQEVAQSVGQLCRIARLAQTEELSKRIEQELIRRVQHIRTAKLDWPSLIPAWDPGLIEKAAVLKPYIGPRERGVVLVSFEYQWARLLGMPNLAEFAERYQLIVAPTWSPPHSIECTLFAEHYPDRRIVTTISNEMDLKIFPRLSPKLHPVPLYASNWVNPDLYPAVEYKDKDIDIVMVAGFGTYKRHFALFDALRHLPAGIRVVLVGQPQTGRSREVLLGEADAYGVRDRIELWESVPDHVVTETLARAKISVILSMQEGSCVAVVESMIANTPVGVMRDAIVGSKAMVNQDTGRLLDHEGLAEQLQDFLAKSATYSPRRRALEEGWCCYGSTKKLNAALKQSALELGEAWTQDIAVHHWRWDPTLLHGSDRERMAPSYQELSERFGITLGHA